MEIQKERFEAWLFSQPDDDKFRYNCIGGCLIARFLKAQGIPYPTVFHHHYYISGGQSFGIPDWLTAVVHDKRIWERKNIFFETTMAVAKQVYIELHGDPAKVKEEEMLVNAS